MIIQYFKKIVSSSALLLFVFFSPAQNKSKAGKNLSKDFTLTSRINSTGHFPYTGSFLNHHLNADFNLYYQKKNAGFFIFKSLDLEDLSSDVNYLQPGIFYKYHAGKKITLAPYVGYVFEQTRGFADKSSDVFVALVTTFKNRNIKIENTSLFLNFLELGATRNLTNRLEINIAFQRMGLSWFTWHKASLFGIREYVSTAFALKFPKISFSKNMALESSIMFQSYVTNNKPSYAFRRGVLFTLAFPLDLNLK